VQIAPAIANDSDGAHAAADLLLQQAQAGSKSKEEAKIEKAGRDFESILLGSWPCSSWRVPWSPPAASGSAK
jgi:hypothetical protein